MANFIYKLIHHPFFPCMLFKKKTKVMFSYNLVIKICYKMISDLRLKKVKDCVNIRILESLTNRMICSAKYCVLPNKFFNEVLI